VRLHVSSDPDPDLAHLPPPPAPLPGSRSRSRSRSSRRTCLIALLGPAVLWASGCLVAAAHLPSRPPGVECTADTLACLEGTRSGAIVSLVAGMVVLVPIITAVTASCAAVGRTIGRVLLAGVLGFCALEAVAMAVSGPR